MDFIVERKAGLIKFDKEKMLKDLKEQLKQFENIKLESEEDLQDFKNKRAGLNKVKKVIDDERKRIKKEYSQPLKDFESDVKELTSKIEEVNNEIDRQIKEVEDKSREEKHKEIENLFNDLEFENTIKLDDIFDERWLNTTYSLSKVEQDLITFKNKVFAELKTINAIAKSNTDYSLMKSEYLKSFDVNQVLQNYKEKQELIEESKKEEEKDIKEEIKNEGLYTLIFEVKASKSQIKKLKEFLEDNKIEHKRKGNE